MHMNRAIRAKVIDQVLAQRPHAFEFVPIDLRGIKPPLRRCDMNLLARELPLMIAGVDKGGMTFGYSDSG